MLQLVYQKIRKKILNKFVRKLKTYLKNQRNIIILDGQQN